MRLHGRRVSLWLAVAVCSCSIGSSQAPPDAAASLLVPTGTPSFATPSSFRVLRGSASQSPPGWRELSFAEAYKHQGLLGWALAPGQHCVGGATGALPGGYFWLRRGRASTRLELQQEWRSDLGCRVITNLPTAPESYCHHQYCKLALSPQQLPAYLPPSQPCDLPPLYTNSDSILGFTWLPEWATLKLVYREVQLALDQAALSQLTAAGVPVLRAAAQLCGGSALPGRSQGCGGFIIKRGPRPSLSLLYKVELLDGGMASTIRQLAAYVTGLVRSGVANIRPSRGATQGNGTASGGPYGPASCYGSGGAGAWVRLSSIGSDWLLFKAPPTVGFSQLIPRDYSGPLLPVDTRSTVKVLSAGDLGMLVKAAQEKTQPVLDTAAMSELADGSAAGVGAGSFRLLKGAAALRPAPRGWRELSYAEACQFGATLRGLVGGNRVCGGGLSGLLPGSYWQLNPASPLNDATLQPGWQRNLTCRVVTNLPYAAASTCTSSCCELALAAAQLAGFLPPSPGCDLPGYSWAPTDSASPQQRHVTYQSSMAMADSALYSVANASGLVRELSAQGLDLVDGAALLCDQEPACVAFEVQPGWDYDSPGGEQSVFVSLRYQATLQVMPPGPAATKPTKAGRSQGPPAAAQAAPCRNSGSRSPGIGRSGVWVKQESLDAYFFDSDAPAAAILVQKAPGGCTLNMIAMASPVLPAKVGAARLRQLALEAKKRPRQPPKKTKGPIQ